MSDAWEEIQNFKSKRNNFRKKLEDRKKGLQDILSLNTGLPVGPSVSDNAVPNVSKILKLEASGSSAALGDKPSTETSDNSSNSKPDEEVEKYLLKCLCEATLTLPTDSRQLVMAVRRMANKHVPHVIVMNLLQKFAFQELVSICEKNVEGEDVLEIEGAEHTRLSAVANELEGEKNQEDDGSNSRKRKAKDAEDELVTKVVLVEKEEKKDDKKDKKEDDIMSLLSMPSTREKETKKVGEEILDLLSKPTAKEKSLAERFRSQGGAQVMEFCPHGTKLECMKVNGTHDPCKKLHFKKIIQKHTDEALGDCSFLNTCFHMDTCKYVHYEVDGSTVLQKDVLSLDNKENKQMSSRTTEMTVLYQPQWIQCDLRYLDMTALGKFAVIMADPPWDIHMELPYGTMSDDEMRQLNIPALQDDGLIFLWVTGRAMELGRECLQLWGYERVDEIIWVKTNQLQRIIRTGRTGHWLNHGKEHCLVGMKGNPQNLNRGLDCDVIVAEVRATSHKPDEIYGIIERLSPGTRKIELFGRMHNVQPNWITLGNQLDGVKLIDPELIKSFKKHYPDGNSMAPPKT